MASRITKIISPPPELDPQRLPRHIAIIMDGNGRWARSRGLPREAGHQAGVKPVHQVVEACARLGTEVLTLYAFSAENWSRPHQEVSAIMRLLMQQLRQQLRKLVRNNVRFRMIGARDGLPEPVLIEIDRVVEETTKNSGLILNLALNYGSRQELIATVKTLAEDVRDGKIAVESIDQQMISDRLSTGGQPDPDLLIRTSGEVRISNFLLWQLAYSEFYLTRTLWPDFSEQELYKALLDYQDRSRRFGGVTPGDAQA